MTESHSNDLSRGITSISDVFKVLIHRTGGKDGGGGGDCNDPASFSPLPGCLIPCRSRQCYDIGVNQEEFQLSATWPFVSGIYIW